METRGRQVHLDFHTSQHITGVGKDFNGEKFAKTLKKAHVDSITCFARCHHGWLYYPSEKFSDLIHPHLENHNLLLEQIAACHKEGINAPIYTTVQWDHQVMQNHPDWLSVDGNGEFIDTQGVPAPHFYHTICLNSPYRQYFKDLLVDLIDVVKPENIDGIFMDILFAVPCDCKYCQAEMKKHGFNHEVEQERLAYSYVMLSEFKKEITALIEEKAPKATIFYNSSHIGPQLKDDLPYYSHLELESLPSGGWGYDHFPITMRYSRNLGKNCIGMTGKFHTYWGDFHSLKNKEALEFECFQMLALGGGCSIGDQLHPDGVLSEAAYDLIGHVYEKVEKVEEKIQGDRPLCEVAVYTPEANRNVKGKTIGPAILGANRMLSELNIQFDIIDFDKDITPYKVVILPDEIEYHKDLEERIQAFIKQGGKVIGSYTSLLQKGVTSPVFGVNLKGESHWDRDFIMPNNRIGKKLPQEEFVMYLKGMEVALENGEEILETRKPFFNREGKTFTSHQHAPSTREKGEIGATYSNGAYYFSHPIFALYRKNAPAWVKEIIKDALLEALGSQIVIHNGPKTLQVLVNENTSEEKLHLHLLHYITEKKSEDIYIIDDIIDLFNTELSLHLPGKKVKQVTPVLQGGTLPFVNEENNVAIKLPYLHGYEVLEVTYETIGE